MISDSQATVVDQDIVHRLESLERAVAAAVQQQSVPNPEVDDSLRGLFVSETMVGRMLAEGPSDLAQRSMWSTAEPAEGTALHTLARRCGLSKLDADLLIVLLAPEIDERFERLFAFLHDDIARKWASPGLALELCGLPLYSPEARARFAPDAPLRRAQLIMVDDAPRPLMTRAAWLPESVVQHLLGRHVTDPELEAVRVYPTVSDAVAPIGDALSLLDDGVIILPDRSADGVVERSVATLRAHGLEDAVVVDASRVKAEMSSGLTSAIVREVSLRPAGLVVVGADALPDKFLRSVSQTMAPVIFLTADPPNASWSDRPLFVLDPETPTSADRTSWWSAHLQPAGADQAPTSLRLGPSEIARTVETASAIGAATGEPVDRQRLSTTANRAARSGLHRLARHVEPAATWHDLIVNDVVGELLRRIASRVAHRDLVMGTWGLSRGGGRGEGTTALFAGPSGTGKTLAAEVIANELGFDLYVVDLSSVVDKYIGETEKNLERIFREAEATNAILFFDEADALFGKRSEVSDAKDRYANIEVAYLLQRMETFDGVSILATNLKANLDDAFTRRLSLIVEFPSPDASARLALWQLLLADAPTTADVDLAALAEHYELTGGTIRSAIETAAYLAATDGVSIDQATLLSAIQHEYEKSGRLWRD